MTPTSETIFAALLLNLEATRELRDFLLNPPPPGASVSLPSAKLREQARARLLVEVEALAQTLKQQP